MAAILLCDQARGAALTLCLRRDAGWLISLVDFVCRHVGLKKASELFFWPYFNIFFNSLEYKVHQTREVFSWG